MIPSFELVCRVSRQRFHVVLGTATLFILGIFGFGQTSAVRAGSGVLSSQLTVHQSRAPSKAQHEIENAQSDIAKGAIEKAQKNLSRALDAYPNYSIALSIQAMLNLNAGRVQEAIRELENAIETDPEYGAPYVMLASVHSDSKRYDEALALLARAQQLIPTAWQTHLQTARALYGKQDYRGALREVTSALRMIPTRNSQKIRRSFTSGGRRYWSN